jgi:hypothetical protein
MDEYKIELWEGIMPSILNLEQKEITSLKEKLCTLFSKKNDIQCNEFYESIHNLETNIGTIENIDLHKIFQDCSENLHSSDFIYLDWGNFEDIVKVKFNDFIDNIDNFWYPSSDDLSIFDQQCNWMLTIHHHGDMGCILA